jgi:hypothetical protein
MKTLHGIVRGRTIDLDEETGLPDGQEVNVSVEPATRPPSSSEALEALKRAAGAWSDDPEGLDRYLEWNRQQRKSQSRESLE